MKTTANFSVIRYKKKVVSVEPVVCTINDAVTHKISSDDVAYLDFFKIPDNRGSSQYRYLGEVEIKHINEWLFSNKLDKIFKHQIVSKEFNIK